MSKAHDDLADWFTAAAEALDHVALEALYAPGAVLWNSSRPSVSSDENRARFRAAAERLRAFRYENVRRRFSPEGYVEQHDVRLTEPDGSERVFVSCLVVTVDDGRISRIDEYINPA